MYVTPYMAQGWSCQEVARVVWNPNFHHHVHWYLFWASRIQSTPSNSITLISFSCYPPIYAELFLVVFFYVLQPQFSMHFTCPPCAYQPRQFDHPNNTLWRVKIMYLPNTQFLAYLPWYGKWSLWNHSFRPSLWPLISFKRVSVLLN
jgi:hypothetical protein